MNFYLIFKKIIKDIVNIFGFEIRRINKQSFTFDDIYKLKVKKDKPMILDVGAYRGESAIRFQKIFPNLEIHCFEPVKGPYLEMKKKFNESKNIITNNFALGSNKRSQTFFENQKKDTSSFFRVNKNSEWYKIKSSFYDYEFSKEVPNIQIDTLDNYIEDKKINFIDILKIDTQGFEAQVLKGSKNTINSNKIKFIETEIVFSNIYERKISFYDIEKNFINSSFELVAVNPVGTLDAIQKYLPNSFKKNILFCMDLLYENKSYTD